jgi:hypothetical protein
MDRIEPTASKLTCETIMNVVLFVVVLAISIEYEYVVDKMLTQGSSIADQHENVWVGTMATYLVVALKLIPLSQACLYLVGIRSRRDDFSSRLARRLTRLAAFPSPSFFDAALA